VEIWQLELLKLNNKYPMDLSNNERSFSIATKVKLSLLFV
jgi:hypothetical protein